MPRPTNTLESYEEEEGDYLEHDWCVFGSDEDLREEAFDEGEDVSQDLSCGTDRSPLDVMGFPIGSDQARKGSRRRRTSNKWNSSFGEAEVDGRRTRNHLPSKSKSLDNDKKSAIAGIARQHRRLPRKSISLGENSKAAVAAVALQHRGRRGISARRLQSGEENPLARNNRQNMTGTSRRSLCDQGDLDLSSSQKQTRRASKSFAGGNRGPNVSRNADRTTSGERPNKSSSRRGSVTKEEEESAEERMKRIKELSNAFKAANILNKGFVPKTDHLKLDVL